MFNLKTMNYSTLKKTVALSFVSLMAVGALKAQTTSNATTTTAKVFGGSDQYNTWSIGVNVGATSPMLATGGSSSDFTRQQSWFWLRRFQLKISCPIHSSFQFALNGGQVSASSTASQAFVASNSVWRKHYSAFKTNFWQGSISGVVNVATIDYLRRENAINFYGSVGVGLANYTNCY